jgi:hypothetical protein
MYVRVHVWFERGSSSVPSVAVLLLHVEISGASFSLLLQLMILGFHVGVILL